MKNIAIDDAVGTENKKMKTVKADFMQSKRLTRKLLCLCNVV